MSSPNPSTYDIKRLAQKVGFDLCGITDPEVIPKAAEKYQEWLKNGFQAEMGYMAKDPKRRIDPSLSLAGVQSVIVVALNYFQPDSTLPSSEHGRIAKYARGMDYHKVFERKTRDLLRLLKSEFPELDLKNDFKSYVDYGPVLERAYAEKAGLGYIGKNSMLITREYGSWVLLGAIFTRIALESDPAYQNRHGRCGTCQRCIDQCPTSAIVGDGVVDSARCISYLTIEKRGEISQELGESMADLVFGCDICQDVCPHNGRGVINLHPEFNSQNGAGEFLDLRDILRFRTDKEFTEKFQSTPLTRPKLAGLQRNASISLSNAKRKQTAVE